jgi:hypothetical protein
MPVCNVCDAYFTGSKCRCGASAETKADGREDRKEPIVNYCEFGNCGIPSSIGQTFTLHLPRYCPWHRQIDRLDSENRVSEDTFEKFQVWRKERAQHSPIADFTVWEAMHGTRKLTYRPVGR